MSFFGFSHRQTESFVPEAQFFGEKNDRACRVCFEDCAVLDSTDAYRTVAFRGASAPAAVSYFDAMELPTSEFQFLQSALSTHTRALLSCPRGPLLIFADLLSATGFLIVVRPHLSDAPSLSDGLAAVVRALRVLRREDVALSSLAMAGSLDIHRGDDAIRARMEELFFYMDSFCVRSPLALGLRTVSMRIAAFAGCDPESVALPVQELSCMRVDQMRLVALLLCIFLTLRGRRGVSCFDGGQGTDQDETPAFRYEVSVSSERLDAARFRTSHAAEETCSYEKAPFLSCSAFKDIRMSETEDGFCLETLLRTTRAYAVRAVGAENDVLLSIRILPMSA